MFDDEIEKEKKNIISSLCDLIDIPSVYSDIANPSAPFGENIQKALNYMLTLGNQLGFRTKNIDGYCGYIEFGEGKDLVGIIGHLDVVPVDDNWTFPPFDATIQNGNIYGRGAIDDKGPVIASLYAMKTVMNHAKVQKRVRLILGLNEERDWKCIERYKEKEEIPTVSFSPDADFPCIYAEKALLNIYLTQSLLTENIKIKEIEDNHNAMNVVPKYCKVTLEINPDIIRMDEFKNTIQTLLVPYSSIELLEKSEKEIQLISHGISAHAAHPDFGKNAISKLLLLLQKIFKQYDISIPLLDFTSHYLKEDFNGKELGIDYFDESGKLTLNVSKFVLNNNQICLGMNLRIPINTKIENIKERFLHLTRNTQIQVSFDGEKEALFLPKDNELVTTLCHIFNEYTNQNLEPIAIGGATYARAFPNCISFGANMPGDKDMCHQADEFISINNLILTTKIYAKAIYELAQ